MDIQKLNELVNVHTDKLMTDLQYTSPEMRRAKIHERLTKLVLDTRVEEAIKNVKD